MVINDKEMVQVYKLERFRQSIYLRIKYAFMAITKTLTFCCFLFALSCSTRPDSELNNTISEVQFESKEMNQQVRDSVGASSFIKLEDGFTYYELRGPASGETIVLVHGFSVPSYIWDSTFMASIAKGYRVLRFDNFGRGFSDRPEIVYDINLSYRQLSGLIDSLKLSIPVNLVGLSWGSRVVTYYAALNSHKVNKLILVDPSGFEQVEKKDSTTVKVSASEVSKAIQERAPFMAESQLGDFYHPEKFAYWPTLYKTQMIYKGFVYSLLSTIANKRDLSLYMTALAVNGTPVKLIMGKEDRVVKPSETIPLAQKQIPAIDITLIENAGHLPHIEESREFNKVFFEFLERDY